MPVTGPGLSREQVDKHLEFFSSRQRKVPDKGEASSTKTAEFDIRVELQSPLHKKGRLEDTISSVERDMFGSLGFSVKTGSGGPVKSTKIVLKKSATPPTQEKISEPAPPPPPPQPKTVKVMGTSSGKSPMKEVADPPANPEGRLVVWQGGLELPQQKIKASVVATNVRCLDNVVATNVEIVRQWHAFQEDRKMLE